MQQHQQRSIFAAFDTRIKGVWRWRGVSGTRHEREVFTLPREPANADNLAVAIHTLQAGVRQTQVGYAQRGPDGDVASALSTLCHHVPRAAHRLKVVGLLLPGYQVNNQRIRPLKVYILGPSGDANLLELVIEQLQLFNLPEMELPPLQLPQWLDIDEVWATLPFLD